MKKFLIATMLLVTLFISNTSAEKIIPHPESYDPASEGAAFYPDNGNHPDSIYYKQFDFYDMESTDSRIILTHYPTYQQMTEYSCGPACALTVLYYYNNRDYDEQKLVKLMKTKPLIGTSPGNMIKFFQNIGWKVKSSLNTPPFKEVEDFQKFVIRNLSQGKPIMVENVEFGGHWRVIIGIDTMGTEDNVSDDVLIMVDPFDVSDHSQDGYAINNMDRFFSMWFDHNMLPKSERNQPWIIATPN